MTTNEKIVLLEEVMDVEAGSIAVDTNLDDIDEWDSLSILTLITEVKKRFDISLTTAQIREFKTIDDICKVIPD